MPTLETSEINGDTIRVRVEPGELVCDGGKPLPYSTWIGTISRRTRKVKVWTPAAHTPRGYRSAALRLLETLAESI